MTTQQSNTVILGCGIIGASTAYYLSQSPSTSAQSIHLVEASPELFASASGYAGGFLARDWFGPSLAQLGALSFDLHKELADKNDGRKRWGYSPSTGTSMITSTSSGRWDGSRAEVATAANGSLSEPKWLTRRRGDKLEVISDEDTVAQIDPRNLCQFLLGESLDRGVRLHHPARAISVSKDTRGELAVVRIAVESGEEVDIPCSRLLIAAGAWSAKVFATLFPESTTRIPVSSLAGHSLVLRSPRWSTSEEDKGCHAVFTTDPAGYSPEVFSRIGGEIYIAGVNDSTLPLPIRATDAKPHSSEIEKLKITAKRILSQLDGEDDLQIVREGLCFRPVTARGPPIVSRIPDSKLGDGISTRGAGEGGVFLAAGHGPWGISQSLGTGKVMSEIIEGKSTSANVKGLSM